MNVPKPGHAATRGLSALVLCGLLAAATALAQPAARPERASRLIGQEVPAGDGGQLRLHDIVVQAGTGTLLHGVAAGDQPVPLERLGVQGPGASPAPGERRAAVRLREVVGARLANGNGDPIGGVEDVVLDFGASKVDFVVVRFDKEWLGTPKRVAVPWRALLGRSGEGTWRLDADPARALSLPELPREQLQRIGDEAVAQDVHRKLRQTPWLRSSQSGLQLEAD